ncbi:MAG: hypothetical protein EAY75_08325 [Bacteroidetes bacterium]|nr:MAG: hypothetical protein EAY75_08325 [Bacteroidota bacterium]
MACQTRWFRYLKTYLVMKLKKVLNIDNGMEYLLFFALGWLSPACLHSQLTDTVAVEKLYSRLYLLPENEADSIAYYANQIMGFSEKANFKKGMALAQRLLGIAAEYNETTNLAIDHYLKFERYARELNDTLLIASALSDAAGIYAKLKQYGMAKTLYLQYNQLMSLTASLQKLAKGLGNLGVIYRKENNYDSAFFYYNKALSIRQKLNDSAGVATVQNNMASLLLYQQKPAAALPYIYNNLRYHLRNNNTEDLWFDYTNLASAHTLQKAWAKAIAYGDTALSIAAALKALGKQADTYEVLKDLYAQNGDYKKAFECLTQQTELRNQIVNDANNEAIAALRETFDAEKRAQENRLLKAEVQSQNTQKRSFFIVMIGALLAALGIGLALLQNQKARRRTDVQNQFINRQNEALVLLNAEKNSLVGMVSHDLATPFAQIRMGQQVLEAASDTLSTQQQQALALVNRATQNGERLIQHILNVEKSESLRHNLLLEDVQVGRLLADLVSQTQPLAAEKNIAVATSINHQIQWLTDRHLFERIVENLLSNAIKYTAAGKGITVQLNMVAKALVLEVKDEGIGISNQELPFIFSPFARISNVPTGGEPSTGLGLSIVKRLATELNATVEVESAVGTGTCFRVVFS